MKYMNRISLSKRLILALVGLAALIIGLIVAIYLTSQRQEIRQRAEQATIISLTPKEWTQSPGGRINFEIEVDPGINQVNFIQLEINFDETKLIPADDVFTPNPSSGLALLSGPTTTPGTITIALSAEGDPTKILTSITKVGTLTFDLLPDAGEFETEVTFGTGTIVRSIGGTDLASENVLSNALGAKVFSVGEKICRADEATCEWDPVDGATSYHYVITNDKNETIKEGDTSSTKITFPVPANPATHITYTCKVRAANKCASGPEGSASTTCVISPTPTPTPTATSTPVPSSTPTPTPTATPTPTPTPKQGVTPTPTEVVESPPSTPPIGGEEEAPIQQPQESEEVVVVTPTPLPPTGNTAVTTILGIGGTLLFIIGAALFFVF